MFTHTLTHICTQKKTHTYIYIKNICKNQKTSWKINSNGTFKDTNPIKIILNIKAITKT